MLTICSLLYTIQVNVQCKAVSYIFSPNLQGSFLQIFHILSIKLTRVHSFSQTGACACYMCSEGLALWCNYVCTCSLCHTSWIGTSLCHACLMRQQISQSIQVKWSSYEHQLILQISPKSSMPLTKGEHIF